jgi:predicted enzyme related to lactoylglutathione lyase
MARPDDAPAQGVPCWLDLASPDVERAAAFYAALFGWSYDVSGPEYGHYHMALKDGRAVAGLGQMPEGTDTPSMWAVYVRADDTAAMSEHAVRLGGTIVEGPMEVPGQGLLAVVQDPAGAILGLWQPLGHRGFGVTHEHGAYGWCEVNVPDADVARAFYTELLGAQARPLASDAIPTRYEVLSKGNDEIAGILQMTAEWEGVPPHWMPYFEVDDCDATVAAAQEAGGTVSVPPFDLPYGRIAVITDPFGAVFSVNQTQRP